jgi:hypothetical protein
MGRVVFEPYALMRLRELNSWKRTQIRVTKLQLLAFYVAQDDHVLPAPSQSEWGRTRQDITYIPYFSNAMMLPDL